MWCGDRFIIQTQTHYNSYYSYLNLILFTLDPNLNLYSINIDVYWIGFVKFNILNLNKKNLLYKLSSSARIRF